MQLTNKKLETVQGLYRDAKMLGTQGRKREASELGVKALSIFNDAAVQKIETNTYESKEHLIYTDISVPLPVKADTKIYRIEIGLIDGSPLAQDILAVLKKYNELGYPEPHAGDEIDLSTMEF
ncbi:hypothetical protein [Ktedonobacter racemifer]|uniref:Uncharacterized protein n=1 Tax=Ktedonobacter racemifer DSM 44963 TaxID=485913 RepID=D6U289_KTERA|nr:hypothetical protein [Ktedonobacter racemifer]EFH82757.1 hypothetical protein Krac_3606 [Ktedonobacter racemifer DSM 44963]